MTKKMNVGILTGGADVPALNAVLRSTVISACKEGFNILGIKNGWNGLINIDRNKKIEEQAFCQNLDLHSVHTLQRKGGSVIGTSRLIPSETRLEDIPDNLEDSP